MSGWNEIIGHKDIVRYMRQSVLEGTPSHAYLLSGSAGVGKSMTAEIFAQALQCTASEGERPCGCCHSCIQAAGGNHPDIVRITHEKPNLITVQEVREQLVDDMAIKPYSGRYKIYLIEDADLMNVQAQNAFLKTLEEPPAYGVMILMSTTPESLLQTIRSRCVMLKFHDLEKRIVRSYLETHLRLDPGTADLCASFARGSIGKAVLLAQSEEFEERRQACVSLLKRLPGMDRAELLERLKAMAEQKDMIREYLEFMEAWFRDVLLYMTTEDQDRLIFKQEQTAIAEQAATCTLSGVKTVLEGLNTARDRLRANVSFELVLDLLLLTIKENI